MRDFITKIDNTAPAASGILKAKEDNVRFEELEQAVKTANISLDPADGPDTDKKMLAQAIARYASGAQWAQDQGVKNAHILKAVGTWITPKALFGGMWVRWIPGATNDAACTANVFDLGVKSILDWNGAELGQGALTQNRPTEMFYSATSDAWILAPWSDARNVSGDATTDPGGDPSEDTTLVAMGGDTLSNETSFTLDPLSLGAQVGDLMVVVTLFGPDSGTNLGDTVIPAGWSEKLREMLDYTLIAPRSEIVVSYIEFVGTPPSSEQWTFPADSDISYAWFIIRNATVIENPTLHEPSQDSPGLVSFNVTRDLSQELILVAALASGGSGSVSGEDDATLNGLQQSGRDTTPNLDMLSLFGMTTAEGVTAVSFTTTEVHRSRTKNVWIPISRV